jgi:hypothetical protein
MDEMLIRFSLISIRWMTTPTPPLESTDGSVAMGCIAPGFPPCSGMCCTTRGDNLDNTLDRAAHQTLTEFCECHLLVLSDTAIALLPVRNEGNAVWSERVAVIGNPELPTHHVGSALMARYVPHVSSLLQEVTVTGAHLCLRLEECAS